VTSVAELKAAIDAAVLQVTECQTEVRLASEKLTEAQQTLALALDGSGHDAVTGAQAALAQAALELEECLNATLSAVEQAQNYAANL